MQVSVGTATRDRVGVMGSLPDVYIAETIETTDKGPVKVAGSAQRHSVGCSCHFILRIITRIHAKYLGA